MSLFIKSVHLVVKLMHILRKNYIRIIRANILFRVMERF